jgi:hypothetical protein
MSSTAPKRETEEKETPARREHPDIPGLLLSPNGAQPVQDWEEFLRSLPKDEDDGGGDLLEAVMENRRMRRELAQNMEETFE